MTQDTYNKIVTTVLRGAGITIKSSQQPKLNALARKVARGECEPQDTIAEIETIFYPFVDRRLRQELERAL